MSSIMEAVDRLFGRTPKHAVGFGAVLTVAVIAARLADERAAARKLAAYHGSVARQAAVVAAMEADTLTMPVVVGRDHTAWKDPAIAIRDAVVVCDGAIVPGPAKASPDPVPTLPLTRAELLELVEVDGGRPLHELDYVNRYAMGGAR